MGIKHRPSQWEKDKRMRPDVQNEMFDKFSKGVEAPKIINYQLSIIN